MEQKQTSIEEKLKLLVENQRLNPQAADSLKNILNGENKEEHPVAEIIINNMFENMMKDTKNDVEKTLS